MRSSSAKIIDKVNYRDRFGASRWHKLRECIQCGAGEWLTKVTSSKCSKCRDNYKSPEHREKISKTLKEKYKDPVYKSRIIESFKPKSGKDHWNWHGGTSTDRVIYSSTPEYRSWRKDVFERDSYKCRTCNKGGDVHAHHIIPWSMDPTKGLDINNGITLCKPCHTFVHKYYKEVRDQSK